MCLVDGESCLGLFVYMHKLNLCAGPRPRSHSHTRGNFSIFPFFSIIQSELEGECRLREVRQR